MVPAARKLIGDNCASVTDENTKLHVQLSNVTGTSRSPMHKTLKGKRAFPVVFDS